MNNLLSFDYLKKLNHEEIINIILNIKSEDDKLFLLRDTNFISEMPSFILELIINNISLTSALNMFQNEELLNKIQDINIDLSHKDIIFIKDYLNNNFLVNKTNHNMLKKMLINSSKQDIISYLTNTTILNKLTNIDIIEIATIKKIDLKSINLINRFNKNELIKYINQSCKSKINYDIVTNDYIKSIFFNKDIDENEFKYLYDFLSTKSNQHIKNINHNLSTYKAVLSLYLLFGFDKSINILQDKHKSINDIVNIFEGLDINKLKINNELIDFVNTYFMEFFKRKQNNIVFSLGNMINNYDDNYKKLNSLKDIDDYLLNKYNTYHLPKTILKDNINKDFSTVEDSLEQINNILNYESKINIIGKNNTYSYQTLNKERKLLNNNINVLDYDFIIEIDYNNQIYYFPGTINNNYIIFKDNNTIDLEFIFKDIANNILDDNINYVIVDTNKNFESNKLSNSLFNQKDLGNYYLLSSNKYINELSFKNKQKTK